MTSGNNFFKLIILQVINLLGTQQGGSIDLDDVWLVLVGLIYASVALLTRGKLVLFHMADHAPGGWPSLVPMVEGVPRQSRALNV